MVIGDWDRCIGWVGDPGGVCFCGVGGCGDVVGT